MSKYTKLARRIEEVAREEGINIKLDDIIITTSVARCPMNGRGPIDLVPERTVDITFTERITDEKEIVKIYGKT